MVIFTQKYVSQNYANQLGTVMHAYIPATREAEAWPWQVKASLNNLENLSQNKESKKDWGCMPLSGQAFLGSIPNTPPHTQISHMLWYMYVSCYVIFALKKILHFKKGKHFKNVSATHSIAFWTWVYCENMLLGAAIAE